MTTKEDIKKYLEDNTDLIIDIATDLNHWDGSFPQFDVWDLAEMAQCYCQDYHSAKNFVDVLLNSLDNLDSTADWARFDEYGDYIESVTDEQLHDEALELLPEIIDKMLEEYDNIYISDDKLHEMVKDYLKQQSEVEQNGN